MAVNNPDTVLVGGRKWKHPQSYRLSRSDLDPLKPKRHAKRCALTQSRRFVQTRTEELEQETRRGRDGHESASRLE